MARFSYSSECFSWPSFISGIWRRYPPAEDGWITGATMILLLSFAFTVAGMMLDDLSLAN